MHNHFYLVCPTDCLEYTINKKFRHEKYFYTSLGNSFSYDRKTIEHLKKTIIKYRIKEIYFVLSIDNKIVLDALGNKEFSNIGVLRNLYNEIRKQKERSKMVLKSDTFQFAILSYYLNSKIKELELQLTNCE